MDGTGMSIFSGLLRLGLYWLGLIGFILVMGMLAGIRQGLGGRIGSDLDQLIAGAFFVGTMVFLLLGVAKLFGWIASFFRRA